MAKRGPAPMPPEQHRTVRVNVYLHPDEAAALDRARARVSLQRGPYMRLAALDRLPPTIPEVNREAWAELARLAGNLNQYQRAVNEGRIDSPMPLGDMAALRDMVDALRRELVGMSNDDEGDDEVEY